MVPTPLSISQRKPIQLFLSFHMGVCGQIDKSGGANTFVENCRNIVFASFIIDTELFLGV
jgi:hypothetical protein